MTGFVRDYGLLRGQGFDLGPYVSRFPFPERTMLRHYASWGRWKYLAYWSELWGSVAEGLEPLEKGG